MSRGSAVTKSGWSRLLAALGAVLLALGILCGLVNRQILDGDRFAGHVDAIRKDPAVAQQVGDAVVQRAVTANPDLLAVRPLLEATAAALVGSPAFGPIVRVAARDLHGAFTGRGNGGVVLRVSDAVTVLAAVLPTIAPGAANRLPARLPVTLLDASRGAVGARVVRAVHLVGVLSWLLPLLGLAVLLAAWWLAPDRRRGTTRVGCAVIAAGVLLGVAAFVAAVIAARADDQTLRGALIAASWRELRSYVWTAAGLAVVTGVLIALSASGRLPDLRTILGWLRTAVVNRPTKTWGKIARAGVLVLGGAAIALNPTTAVAVFGFALGLALVVGGLGELAPTPQPRDATVRRTRRTMPLMPAIAAGAAAVLIVGLVAFNATPADSRVTTTPANGACNGHVELCGRHYDQVAYPATHNAMSAADEPSWFVPEQPTGLVGQLEAGIRVLLIDTYYGQRTERQGLVATAPQSYEEALAEARRDFGPDVVDSALRLRSAVTGQPTGPVEPYMCHGLCELGSTPWEATMASVKAWLDLHPREVVTFFVEDNVSPADTNEVFAKAGLLPYVYAHPPGTPWPTLGQMIDSGHRVVVLMENHGGGTAYPRLLQGFDEVQDTPFTNPTVSSLTCRLNRGLPSSPLFMLNYWLIGYHRLVSNARKINVYDELWPYAQRCQTERGRLPNFVAVNFYDEGDLFRVVDRLNGFG